VFFELSLLRNAQKTQFKKKPKKKLKMYALILLDIFRGLVVQRKKQGHRRAAPRFDHGAAK
jgi:hypothetical protein